MTEFTIKTSDPAVIFAVLGAMGHSNMLIEPSVAHTYSEPTPSPEPVATGRAITDNPEDRRDPTDTDEVDSNGMKWDAEIHAETRGKNADGSWKARRGKADEAKAALAAFKADGGGVEPPTNLPEPPVAVTPEPEPAPAPAVMPGLPSGQMPGLPGAAVPVVAPAPVEVTQDMLEAKILGMLKRGVLSTVKYTEVLQKHRIDLSNPSSALNANPGLRSALYADMCEIEPEA